MVASDDSHVENDAPLFNSQVIRLYVEYIHKFQPDLNVDHLLSYAGIAGYELEDQGHWFTQWQADRFNELLTKMTGDSQISRKVGRYATDSKASGILRQYALGLLSPKSAYWALEKLVSKLTRALTLDTRQIGSNKVEATFTPNPGVKEKPYQCENRIGWLESVAKVFTNKFARIEHPICMHAGGDICQYIISWEMTPYFFLKRMRNYAILLSALISLVFYFALPFLSWLILLLTCSLCALLCSLIDLAFEKKELTRNVERQGDAAKGLLDEMNIRYNNALLGQEIGQATSTTTKIDKLIDRVIRVLKKRLDFDRGMIMLANREKTRLLYAGGFGYGPEEELLLRGTDLHLDIPESRGVFVLCFRDQEPFLIDNITDIKQRFSERSRELIEKMNVQSLICVPIVYEKESLGILAVDNIQSKRPLTQSDMNILRGVSSQTAVSIVNVESYHKLLESEKKYRELVENSNSIIIRADPMGNIRFFNEFAQRFFDYAEDEIVGKSVGGLVLSGAERMTGSLKEFLVSFQQYPERQDVRESENILKNGQKVWIAWTIKPIFDVQGALREILCIGNDITELKKSEQETSDLVEQLQRSQKLEAIGTLAGGIAHDFNNILAAIIGYTELADLEIPEKIKGKHYLKEVLKASGVAKNLVQQILSFSRRSKLERKPVNITSIVKESCKMLRSTLPTTLEIRQNIDSRPGMIMADYTQIHQILMNLCTNASHALQKNGGIIEVSLTTVDIAEGAGIPVPGLLPGTYQKLSVMDTGYGMSPEALRRIFDPYFTTKEKGEGTGLGLSVVHGIVKNHDGAITVHSEEGKGTTFDIYFPQISDAVVMEPTDEESPLSGGHGRILFIDDEQDLVVIWKALLERLGYEVDVRTSSVEALKLFEAHPDRFDLVVTDLTMPDITGEKLAMEMMKIRPDIPIILCTGFSERISEEEVKAIGIREFVMKPLAISELGKTIQRTLSEQIVN